MMLLSTLQGVMRNVQDVLHLATYVSVGVSASEVRFRMGGVEVCKWMCNACQHKPKYIHTSTCTATIAQLHLHSPPPVQLRMHSQQGRSEPDPISGCVMPVNTNQEACTLNQPQPSPTDPPTTEPSVATEPCEIRSIIGKLIGKGICRTSHTGC